MRKRWAGFSLARRAFIVSSLGLAAIGVVSIVLIAARILPFPPGWLVIPCAALEIGLLIAGPLVARHDQNRELDEIAARVAAEDEEAER